jgi:DnaK suppressor protein
MAIDPDEARQLILAERERITRLLAGEQDQLDHADAVDVDETDVDQGETDSASDDVERQKDRAVLGQFEDELAELDAALSRVDAGTYGIDEVTGEPIAEERLRAVPAARTNVASAPEGPRGTA